MYDGLKGYIYVSPNINIGVHAKVNTNKVRKGETKVNTFLSEEKLGMKSYGHDVTVLIGQCTKGKWQ